MDTIKRMHGLKAFLFVAAFLLGGPAFSQQPAGEVTGTPWVGAPGVTESISLIMGRDRQIQPSRMMQGEAHDLRVMPGRRLHPQNPGALAVASWPLSEQSQSKPIEILPPLNPQTIGVDFLGAQESESGYVPPDCDGAVGPTQFLVCVNGRIRTFARSGAADGAINTTTDNFFGSVRGGSGTSDPHVVFDRLTQRWFLVMINVSTPNRVMIAVSSGATISSGSSFTFFEFQHDSVGTRPNLDTGGFADYPTLGVDNNALYIGVNVFNAAGTAYLGSSAFVVRKSSVTGTGPIVVTPFRQIAKDTVSGPYSPQGVTNDDAAATQGYFAGVDSRFFGLLQIRRVSNPGATPSLSANLSVTIPATYYPSTVPAKGSTPLELDAVDDRLSTAMIKNGSLWASHAIAVTAGGIADTSGTGRGAVRFYEIKNLTTTPALNQAGTLFSSAGANPRFFWNPSIAVSGQGHAAVGSSYAGAADFAGVAYSGRLSADAPGTLQSASLFASSTAYNAQTSLADGSQRWGDFSTTSIDPTDNMTLWTVQEYCNATNSWGVRVTQLKAPPPATPSSALPVSLNQGASNVSVAVTGSSSAGSGFYDPGAGYPNRLSASVSGSGVTVNSVTYTDPTHVTLNLTVAGGAPPGARTITVTNPDGQAVVSSSGILTINGISCPTIALSPATIPNGAAGSPYSQAISASGGTSPYIFSLAGGTLPSGMSLSTSGVLSGTPAFGGSHNFTALATDSNSCTGSRAYSLIVTGCPQVTLAPALLPNGTVNAAYNQAVTGSGGTSPYTFAVTSGTLPAGLALSLAGGLTGTPTAAGSSPITITATDSNSCTGSRGYTFTIDTSNTNSISLTVLGAAYTQDFSTLASSGTSTSLPRGWMLSESGTNANTTYTAGTGSASAGDMYSFGAAGNPDRALGGLQSGNLNPTFGASFTNNTGATITSLSVAYTGEQWRLGATGRTDRIDFQLSTDATDLTTGTYADENALDFSSPVSSGSTGALDGNLSANRTGVAGTITGLNIPAGAGFFIRWTDLNATGADDGLAADDFSITPNGTTQTNPAGTGAANPSTVGAGTPALLTVAVTPGANPASTGITVGGNLASIGGSSTQTFFDDGSNGDLAPGDNTFSFQATVAVGTSPGSKTLPVTIGDAQARTGSASISLAIACPAITLSLPPLPSGKVDSTYNDTLAASGGTPPYAFAVTGGGLPGGVVLSTGGVFSGVPAVADTFTFVVTATDADHCTGSAQYGIRIAPDSSFSVTVTVDTRWNLVSNPVNAANDSVIHLFPTASSGAFFYDPASGYHVSGRLQNRVGYWLRFPSGALSKLKGGPRALDTIDVSGGWNLIGSLSNPISVTSVQAIGTAIVSKFYGYTAGYAATDTLRAGAAYWLKCDLAGKIILSGSPPAFAAAMTLSSIESIAPMNKLIIADANGSRQTLFFGAMGEQPALLERYALPPPPPEGVFDVRFESQRALETYAPGPSRARDLRISINSAHYPVTVRWELEGNGGERYSLVSSAEGGRILNLLRRPSGTLEIAGAQPGPLILRVESGHAIPERASLMNNYPNPFNPSTVIRYAVPAESRVQLKIYDLLGREVKTLINEVRGAGYGSAEWNSTNDRGDVVPSGVYFCRLAATSVAEPAKTSVQSRKLILVR